jgi:tripartite ATP-independent transporter DctM subunit
MDHITISVLGFAVLFFLMFIGMPIGFAMIIVGFSGYAYLGGFDAAMNMIGMVPYTTVASYLFSVLPLFTLMGDFASSSGLMRDGYRAVHSWIGHFPGGLAMATIGGCASFACVSGSSVATAMTMTRTALPEMLEYRYDPRLAAGCLAAGGTLGLLIPPSGAFIIYGLIAEASIGRLFMAGVMPGLLLSALFVLTIYILARIDPKIAPPGATTSWKERISVIKNIWGLLLIFTLVMGGIWGGMFTPTEAGAVGAFIAFLFLDGRKQYTWKLFSDSLQRAVGFTGMAFAVIIGAMVFGYFTALAGLPTALSNFIVGLAIPRLGILLCILAVYIVLGCIMESIPMILLTVPIFLPVLTSLGYDPIWFGVLLVIMTEMALITPPIGMNVFIISGMTKDIPMYTIFRGVIPFVLAMIIGVGLLVAFPNIALFLPNTMMAPN